MGAGTSFDDREGFIWYNGEFTEWRKAQVHVLNHGLHYGSSVFEGIRAYNGKVFKLEEHNQRFHKSAEMLGFEIPYSVKELNEIIISLLEKQGLTDAYIRPVAWLGSEKMKIYAEGITTNVAIAAWQWPGYFKNAEKGINLCWSDWKRPSPETAPVGSKASGLYMICTLSKRKALENGYQDAMMLDYRGNVAEATGANVFFIFNEEIHTPIPDCVLDGITRRTVIDIAKENNIKVVERYIKPNEIADAQEAFLTGTAAEVTSIDSIGEYRFEIGKISKLMKEKYRKLVNNQ